MEELRGTIEDQAIVSPMPLNNQNPYQEAIITKVTARTTLPHQGQDRSITLLIEVLANMLEFQVL